MRADHINDKEPCKNLLLTVGDRLGESVGRRDGLFVGRLERLIDICYCKIGEC